MDNFAQSHTQASIITNLHPFPSEEAELSVPQTKNIYLVPNISAEASTALMGNAKTLTYSKQTVIVSEGNEAHALYMIYSGQVRVFCADDKGREVTLNIQGPGTYFGESDLLADQPSSSSVVSLEKVVCKVISKSDFNFWLINYPEVKNHFLRVLSEKNRKLTEKLKQMALSNVYERTVQTLQEMAVAEGDTSVVHNRASHQELASMVGASREMVNKIMIELTKGGYVKKVNKTLIINRMMPSSW
jgi:CRP/FNR family transcriptional regulator, cyclic AMP receptor protein